MKQLKLKVKQWKKYSPEQQQKILKKYDVILTDWRTLRESYKYHFDRTPKLIEKGIQKMDHGFKMFDKGIQEFDKGFSSLDKLGKTKDIETLFKPKEKDYSKLLGLSNKKSKKDWSILSGGK